MKKDHFPARSSISSGIFVVFIAEQKQWQIFEVLIWGDSVLPLAFSVQKMPANI